MRVKGLALIVEDPGQVTGTSKTGKPYAFYSRRIHLFTGTGNAICSEVHDRPDEFKPIMRGTVQEFSVESARMDGSQLVLRVKVG